MRRRLPFSPARMNSPNAMPNFSAPMSGMRKLNRLNRKRPAGLSWYYVRVLQDDGEIAWGSPMWVHFRANGGTRE